MPGADGFIGLTDLFVPAIGAARRGHGYALDYRYSPAVRRAVTVVEHPTNAVLGLATSALTTGNMTCVAPRRGQYGSERRPLPPVEKLKDLKTHSNRQRR